jgi:hypothetical protein
MHTMKRGLSAIILSLELVSGTAQAKSHLSRDEIKILSSTSVAVVYIDTTQPIHPYIKNNGGSSPMMADAMVQRQVMAVQARLAPFDDTIQGLKLPETNATGVQQALASVPFLHEVPWVSVTRDPKDNFLMHEQGLKTKANIVIFLEPRLMMNDDADEFYLVTTVDIETLDSTGTTLNHYENTWVTSEMDVDDDHLPDLTSSVAIDDEDARAAKLFADRGAAFKQLYAALMQKAQQQLYYYFTGNDTPPPAAATHATP